MDEKRSLLSYIGPGPVLVLLCVAVMNRVSDDEEVATL